MVKTEKRLVIAYSLFIIFASTLFLRLYTLSTNPFLVETASTHSGFKLEAGKTRGNIYDCNFKKLVGEETKQLVAVLPSAEGIKTLSPYLTPEKNKEAIEKSKSMKPYFIELPEAEIFNKNAVTLEVPVRYSANQLCPHIIGYIDSQGKGVMGIEKAYDDLLNKNSEEISVSCARTSNAPYFKFKKINCPPEKDGGVVLTIDKDIQLIASRAMRDVKKGAAIVMDVQTGELRAVVSKPDFSPGNIESALSRTDGCLINRAFTPYSVGSSFKLLIALSALEQGISENTSFVCNGKVDIDGINFCCHYKPGHNLTDMKKAIAWSCNPYFILLAQQLDIEKTRQLASEMGFGSKSYLCEDIFSKAGILPGLDKLQTRAEIANFSFGQGRLFATPVQVTMMTASIAKGGIKINPSMVLGETTDGYSLTNPIPKQPDKRIAKEENAEKIKSMMINAVEKGSGNAAKPKIYTAGGKTASAQTGQYKDGEEIVHAWFTGFFPGEKPKYAITVLCEEGKIGGETSAPIFAEICNKLTAAGKI